MKMHLDYRNWAEGAARRIFSVSEQFIIDYLDIVELNGFDVNEYLLNMLVSRDIDVSF